MHRLLQHLDPRVIILQQGLGCRFQCAFDFSQFARDDRQSSCLLLVESPQRWSGSTFGISIPNEVVEKTGELVVLTLGHWIVLVVMALGALQRQSHHGRRGGIDAIHEILDSIVLIDNSTFIRCRIISQETGRDLLFDRSLGKQIARDLPNDEIAIRKVFVKRVNDPVTPRINGARMIFK